MVISQTYKDEAQLAVEKAFGCHLDILSLGPDELLPRSASYLAIRLSNLIIDYGKSSSFQKINQLIAGAEVHCWETDPNSGWTLPAVAFVKNEDGQTVLAFRKNRFCCDMSHQTSVDCIESYAMTMAVADHIGCEGISGTRLTTEILHGGHTGRMIVQNILFHDYETYKRLRTEFTDSELATMESEFELICGNSSA